MGYVYAIVSFEAEEVKIGFSDSIRTFLNRMSALQRETPYPLGLHSISEHDDARLEETELHHRFKHARLSGEWFYINDPEVYSWLCQRENVEEDVL